VTPEDQLFPEAEEDEAIVDSPMRTRDVAPQAGLASVANFDAFLSEAERARSGKSLALARDAAGETSPDQAARILRLQMRTGLPAELIRSNPDAVEREVTRSDFDPQAFRRESPIVADWMAQSPEHAALLGPEVQKAGALETQVRSIAGAVHDMTLGRIQVELDSYRSMLAGVLEFPAMMARGSGEMADIAARRATGGMPQMTFSIGEGEDELSGTFAQAPSILLELGARPLQSVIEAIEVPEERANYITDVARGLGQLLSQVAVNALTRGQATGASLFAMGVDIQAQQVDQAIERGNAVTQDQRDIAVLLGGAATGITEKLGLDFLLNRLPPKTRNIIQRWVGDLFLAGGGESIQEMSESALQNTITKLYADPAMSIVGLDTLYEGGVGFGAGSIGRALLNLAVPARRRRISEQTRDKVTKLNQTIQDMDLAKKMPDQLEALVSSIKQRTGMDSVWINLGSWQTFFQSQGMDPEKASADILGDGGAAYREAQAATGKIEVPVEKYAAHIATNENAASLEGAVSFAAEEMTADEARIWESEQDKIIEEFRKFQATGEVQNDFQKVYQENLGALLKILPRQTAELVAFVKSRMDVQIAENAGVSIDEIIKQRPVKFGREVPEVLTKLPRTPETDGGLGLDVLLDRLRNNDIPSDRQAYGPSVLDLLREWGIRDEGGELAARDVNLERRPGQRNIARDDGISLDAARERLVELGFLPELPGQTASTGEQDVLDLVDQEMGGRPVFSGQAGDPQAAQLRESLLVLEEFLNQMNADPQELTNDEIAQIVQSGMPIMTVEQIAAEVLDQRTYHGSTARFDAFSTDFMGDGEGFQAFGWGLYFAQARSVAQKYRAGRAGKLYRYEDAPKRPGRPLAPAWQRTQEQDTYDGALLMLQRMGTEVALRTIRSQKAYWQQAYDAAVEAGDTMVIARTSEMVKWHEAREAVILDFQENATEVEEGFLYEVEIDDALFDGMLLWDRTWDQQPESVRTALMANGFNPKDTQGLTGEGIYWQVAAHLYPHDDLRRASEVASKWLASIGIPGNRFFDQNSRTKPMDERTENIVLFDANDAQILAVNGEPVTTLFQSRTLRTGRETLRRYGVDPDKPPKGGWKTRQVAAALEARQRAKYGVIGDKDNSREAARKIANWIVAEVEFELENPDDSGVGWYSTKYQAALDTMGEIFPELKSDPLARKTMTALIAITSDGEKVMTNFRLARDIYTNYRETGKFETQKGSGRESSVAKNMRVLQRLYDKMGVEATHEYLMQEMTVAEYNARARKEGLEESGDYQAHMKIPYAALAFGPKLGAFYANLSGAHGYLTMDRWWSRTFNRYRGTLLTKPTKASMQAFRELTGQPELSDDETIAATVEHAERLEARKFKTQLALLVGQSEPTAAKAKAAWMKKAKKLAGDRFEDLLYEHRVERAANTIYKNAFTKMNDSPFRASDRTFMLEVTEMAQKSLKRKGEDLTIADIQAILWYYEKKLYGALGARDTASISYEEAASGVVAEFQRSAADPEGDTQAAAEVPGQLSDGIPPGERAFPGLETDTAPQQEVAPPVWSDQFRAWFGDSVVVDEQGRPKIVYHGTKRDFEEFRSDVEAGRPEVGGMAGPGFFFTDDPKNAEGWANYSKSREEYRQQFIEKQAIARDRKASKEERAEARAWMRDYNMWISGVNLMPVYLSLQNPMEFDAKNKSYSDIGGLERIIERAKKKGHDGLIVRNLLDSPTPGAPGPWRATQLVAFEPTQIKSAIGNTGEFDPENPSVLFQGADDRDLVARHNLSFDNIRHAIRMGGIAVPSVSIARLSEPFTEFGDVTLIGNQSLIDPRQGAKVFGADVYSPRYPRVDYGIREDDIIDLKREIGQVHGLSDGQINDLADFNDVRRRGPTAFAAQPLMMHHFLVQAGIKPDIVYRSKREDEAIVRRAEKAGFAPLIAKMRGWRDIWAEGASESLHSSTSDMEFIRGAIDYLWQGWIDDQRGKVPGPDAEMKFRERLLKELQDGVSGRIRLEHIWKEMFGATRPPAINGWESRLAMLRQINGNGLAPKYSEWAAKRWDAFGAKERIERWSAQGNRRYEPHLIGNVVRAMKQRIRGGEDPEGTMYGLGPLRAQFTPQFKSITEIRREKGRLVSDATFEAIKDEMDNELGVLADKLLKSYRGSDSYRVLENTLTLMADIPKMGVDRAWRENGFDGAFPRGSEVDSMIREFMERLKNMPTEYFEVIVPRAVQLSEFRVAVVPTDTPSDVVTALREAGLRIAMYQAGNNISRHAATVRAAEAENQRHQVLFQEDPTPPPPFYSALERALLNAPQDKATGEQWLGILRNNGVKTEEIDWYELDTIMGQSTITREELLRHIRAHEIIVEEMPIMGPPLRGGAPVGGPNSVPRPVDEEQEQIEILQRAGLVVTENMAEGMAGEDVPQWAIELDGGTEAAADTLRRMLSRMIVRERPGGPGIWEAVAPGNPELMEGEAVVWSVSADTEPEARQKLEEGITENVYDEVMAFDTSTFEDPYLLLPPEIREAYHILNRIGEGWAELNLEATSGEWDGDPDNVPYDELTLPGGDGYRVLRFVLKTNNPEGQPEYGARRPSDQQTGFFSNSHFNNNLLYWMRTKDRVTKDGKKLLFIEEIQSDWHQKGRRYGYARGNTGMPSGRVPDAPFKTSWYQLALKRAVRFAAENGYDGIAWTSGDVQKKRNSLDSYVRDLTAVSDGSMWNLSWVTNSNAHGSQNVPDSELDAYVGEDIAKQIRASDGRVIQLQGEELALGGAMHQQIYDRNLPRSANKMFKKYGTKASPVQMNDASIRVLPENAFMKLEFSGMDVLGWSNWIDTIADLIDGTEYGEVDPFGIRDALVKIVDDSLFLLRRDYGEQLANGTDEQRAYLIRTMLIRQADNLAYQTRLESERDMDNEDEFDPRELEIEVARQFLKSMDLSFELNTEETPGPMMWELPITEKLADAAMAGQPLFQKGTRAPRGRIEMRGRDEQGVRAFNIILSEGANLSTVLHELGHYYFEIMADLAEMPETSQQVRDDYRLMLRFLGVDSREQVTRAHHEKMARSFEAYLMEGKAPSIELASLFGRMRAWLISVYRHIKNLNAPLNDEIRGVFDRMLASDEAIAAANTAQSLDPMFKDAAEAGMTEQEFQDYQRLRNEALTAAQGELQREVMAVRVRESKAWWKTLTNQTRREVEREVNSQRVYQVLAYLQAGKNADGTPLPEGQEAVRLDRQALVNMYGKDFIKRLPRPYIYTRTDGADPELVAEMFGFDSADQMVQEILAARPKKELIEAETKARMQERYPDPLLDGSLPVVATDAVMSDKAGQILLKELNALERRGGRQQASPMTIIRAAVERILAEKPVRAVEPRRYASFAAQAGKRAQQAMIAGDFETARVEKQRQLLNHELYRQAMKMREEVETIRKYFQRLQKTAARKRLGKAGGAYLDQIDAITQRYELARVSNTKLNRRRSLREFVDSLEDDGQEVGIDSVILDEARRVNYRDVPVQELRAAYDAARQLEHFARLKLKFKTRREQANWKDVKSQLIAAAQKVGKEKRPLDPNTMGWFKRTMSSVRDIDAAMLKMEQIIMWLDGDNVDGPWHRFFWNEFADAQTEKLDLMRDRFAALRGAIDTLTKRTKLRLLDKVYIKSLGESVTRDFLVGFALNMGNASNKKKAIEGMRFTEDQVKEMLDQLTKEEWQLVQTIWDTFESLWPDISALQKEMTGLAPAKIEATPVETKFGTFRGGYYPVVYDPDKSKAGMAQENERLKSSGPFATGYSFATTAKGHVKERVENFTAAMRFSLDVVPNRLARHIHDLTHRQPVVNAHRILTDPEIRAAVQDALGVELERAMYPWLKRQANDSAFDVLDGTSGFKRVMERLRLNTSIVAMGLKMTTMMSQFGGYFDAAEMVGAKWMAVGMKEFYRNPRAATRLASELSGEIRYRFELKDLTVKEQLQRLQGKVDWRSKATRFYFMNILIADKIVATAAWMGEYRKQIADGKSEAVAISAADTVIRLTQGAGGAKDLSAVQATENQLLRWMGMFYTYFNAKYARIRSMGRRGKRVAKGEINELPLLMMQVWWGTFLPAVMSEFFAGRGPGDDDENWALWALQVWIEFPFMTVIGLRDVASPAIQNILPWRERPFPGRYQLTPVQQAGDSMLRFATTAAEGLQGEADLDEVMLRGFEAAGYAYGLPTSQAKITGRYILELLEGEEPESTREAIRNLMYTPRD
jgi:hypothetical protein